MNTDTTAIRTPTALGFDRQALAVDIQRLEKKEELLAAELDKTRKEISDKYKKLNQLAIIAVGRLRKR
jgi:hypothetical protein